MNSPPNENNASGELEDSGITMVDVLQEEEELENDAEAVLGAGDDSSCTYELGYMKRQALYACLTCCPTSSNLSGGICLGCSYHCHEGHDLVELYTKRHFSCDCGNSNFPESNPCKLIKEKSNSQNNVDNKYNQNFKGKYCTCVRPYPDPEDTVEDQMIQCIICEDWYHGRHLGVETVPMEEDYSEMICKTCAPKLSFLHYYLGFAVTAVEKCDTEENVDVTSIVKGKEDDQVASSQTKIPIDISQGSTKEAAKEIISDQSNSVKASPNNCKLQSLKQLPSSTGAVFFTDTFRKELCRCPSCNKLYADSNVQFLIDPEDTVIHYESQGRANRQAQRGIQRELDALSSLDRITRTEVVHEYNNLSTSLREYLKKFADSGKVVRDEDIREFFSELQANKKQKRDGMQYFCK